MTRYFVADDRTGDPTIWEQIDSRDPAESSVVLFRSELEGAAGPYTDLLWSVLVGVLTTGDAIERVADVLRTCTCLVTDESGDPIIDHRAMASEVLAALAQGGR